MSAKLGQIDLKSNIHKEIQHRTNRTCKIHKETINHKK